MHQPFRLAIKMLDIMLYRDDNNISMKLDLLGEKIEL